MKRIVVSLFVVGLVGCLAAASVEAQKRTARSKNAAQQPQGVIDPNTGQFIQNQPGANNKKEEEKGPDLPGDPQLQKIHMEFVAKTAKLAKDYERQGDIAGARECYERILKLIPRLPQAEEALAKIKTKELNAEKKKMIVNANAGWQDTGVDLLEGKPVAIDAVGNWTFRMSEDLGPDGKEIPEELKEFNLGSLIGMINTGGDPKTMKPFLVGASSEFTPEKAGRLFLRMYDSDPSDNAGKLNVEIRGTFEKGK